MLGALLALLVVVLPVVTRPRAAQAAELVAADTYAALVDASRAEAGLAPLSRDPALAAFAQEWADHLAAGGCGASPLCHRSSANLLAVGAAVDPAFTLIGENVGYSVVRGSAAATMLPLHEAFMNSAPHRANLLRPGYNRIGIGVTVAGNLVYIAVNFLQGPPLVEGPSAVLDLRPSGFRPVTPTRLLDTRVGTWVPAGGTVRVRVAGQGSIPADAAAAALNVTIVEARGEGFVTVFPCDTRLPLASSLNHRVGETRANLVVSALGNRDACVYTQAGGHVVVDVTGWFRADVTTGYRADRPSRLLDTRAGDRVRATSVRIPGATAVSANVTVTDPTGDGHLTAWPCGVAQPEASSLNFRAGATVANLVLSSLSGDGRLCLATSVPAHVVVDLQGVFGADTARLRPAAPERILDTRGGAPLAGGARSSVELTVRGWRDVPSSARSVVLNLTVTEPVAAGWIAAYPCDEGLPTVSNLNYEPGQTVANAVVAKLDRQGRVCLASWATTHVVADVTGWMA